MPTDTASPASADALAHDRYASPAARALWHATENELEFPALENDLSVDVAIIGGGITGVTTAALLASTGRRVALLEARSIGRGTTGHSTGNLYATVDEYLYRLAEKWGHERVTAVVQSRSSAINLIENNIAAFELDCDFRRVPWALYSTDLSGDDNDVIEREYRAARTADLDARIVDRLPLPFRIEKALLIERQAQIHPLRYVRQLVQRLRSDTCQIFERTPAVEIDEGEGLVRTPGGVVHAESIIMATHTPKGFNLVQTELGPYREYAVAARYDDPRLGHGIYWSAGTSKHSARLVEWAGERYILAVGEKHKTGQRENTDAAYRALEAFLDARFGARAVAYRWSAQHYRAADGLPYIGLAHGSSRLHLATGFATDGLIYGTVAAMLISDEIQGKRNVYASLYPPKRFVPARAGRNFLKENLNTAGYYIRDYAKGSEASALSEIAIGEGKLIELRGERLAVHRDMGGQLHAVSPMCTHLKCIVHWNSAEQTWDCPCHGSRFEADGTVIEGPALAPLAGKDDILGE